MTSPSAPTVALVTGASRGIGRAIALGLARSGHRVVATARDADRLEELAAEAARDGLEIHPVPSDLMTPDTPERIVQACRRRWAAPEILVNNAGTAPSDRVENTTDAILEEALVLHVRVPLALARGVLPGMRAGGAGCIVNLASTAGLRGFPFTSAYTAAKHGMVGLSRALGAELGGAGIRVYALCPGFVDTDITRGAAAAVAARGKTTAEEAFQRMASQNRIRRMHSTEEVADAVAWLCDERPEGCVYNLDASPPTFVDSP